MSKTVLITGSAGFAGSHLVDHILDRTDWNIVGLDSFRHRGDSIRVVDDKRYRVFGCDLSCPISDRLLDKIGPVDFFVNMAAQSHVDRSIEEPVPFVQNNVNLTLYTLEAARKLRPQMYIQISTDEVYGPAPKGKDHLEWEEILPSNPYAASKAAQEAIAISYWRTYGLPVVITNTMNLVGERQDPEKFVPLCISKILRGERVTIHGNDRYIGTRKYLHCRNKADALLFLMRHTEPAMYSDWTTDVPKPSRYNIVGDIELDNLAMARTIAEIVGKPLDYELVDFHAITTRPGHDRRYSLDGGKIAALGWKAPVCFFTSLETTVKWYLDNPQWLK